LIEICSHQKHIPAHIQPTPKKKMKFNFELIEAESPTKPHPKNKQIKPM
jgi:hypothetical protein